MDQPNDNFPQQRLPAEAELVSFAQLHDDPVALAA
jgi:hypothetical protein